jgi:hypothetical protein
MSPGQAVAQYGYKAVAWTLVCGVVIAGWFAPWPVLCLLEAVAIVEILMLHSWFRVRGRQLVPDTGVPQPTPPSSNLPTKPPGTISIPRPEVRHFRQLRAISLGGAYVAAAYTAFLLASPYAATPRRYTTDVNLPVAVMMNVLVYVFCAVAFFLARRFASTRGLPAWRDSCSETMRDGVGLFVRIFSLSDEEHPGRAWTLSVVLTIGVTVSLSAVPGAAVTQKPDSWPTPQHAMVALQGHRSADSKSPHVSANHVKTSPKVDGSVTTTSTTAPEQAPSDLTCNSTDIKSDLSVVQPMAADAALQIEYENNAATLQCLALDSSGAAITASIGDLQQVEFVSPNGDTQTGVIVFNEVGDTSEIPSGETVFVQKLENTPNVAYVSDLVVIHGAQLRLGVLVGGACFVGLEPDSNSAWTIYPEAQGAAVLEATLDKGQVGRPTPDGTELTYSNPTPPLFISTDTQGKVTVQGIPPAEASAAESASVCPLAATLSKSMLMGPPGP